MYLIAGLGNPTKQYEHTRHNIGFDTITYLADHYHISMNTKKFQGICGSGYIEGQKVLLLMPQTYMNLSGQSVSEAAAKNSGSEERSARSNCPAGSRKRSALSTKAPLL